MRLQWMLLSAGLVTSVLAVTAQAELISGTISSVAASSGRISVQTTADRSRSFRVGDDTQFSLDGKPVKVDQLAAGQRVSIFTSTGGEVTKVVARSGSPAPVASTPKPQPKPATASEPDTPRSSSSSNEWTQFGGPNRDNISTETGLMQSWPAAGPPLKWSIRGLGEGYSSVSLSGNRLLTMGNRGDREMTLCFDVETGRELWATQTGAAYREGQGNGPRGTPTIDGNRVYVLGANGDLACLDLDTGARQWGGNILQEFGGSNITWGISESVLIDGDRLICTPGGRAATMVALDKASGRTIWQARVPSNPQAAYSSIVPLELGGSRQYVNFVHNAVVGIDASSGQALWGNTSAANGTANCSSPLVLGNQVFAASGYGTGGTLIELSGNRSGVQANQVYHTKDMKNHHGGMVLRDGYLYGTDEAILKCLELKTGAVQWQSRSVGKGAVVYADGQIILRSEQGPVAMFTATPTGYQENGRFEPPRSDRPAWPHPVVAAGCLFLRDMDQLHCYRLR